jgi:hypothetical protein
VPLAASRFAAPPTPPTRSPSDAPRPCWRVASRAPAAPASRGHALEALDILLESERATPGELEQVRELGLAVAGAEQRGGDTLAPTPALLEPGAVPP